MWWLSQTKQNQKQSLVNVTYAVPGTLSCSRKIEKIATKDLRIADPGKFFKNVSVAVSSSRVGLEFPTSIAGVSFDWCQELKSHLIQSVTAHHLYALLNSRKGYQPECHIMIGG